MAEARGSGSQQGERELAAPPGSEWCGDKERSQGGEMGTLSGGDSASRRNYGEGNMSGLPDEPLRKGALVCPYAPYCGCPMRLFGARGRIRFLRNIGGSSTGIERFVCDAEKMAWE